jgi:hypothetical protein
VVRASATLDPAWRQQFGLKVRALVSFSNISMKNAFELAPTEPCDSSVSSSIAEEVVVEVREILAILPTGEWRASLQERLSQIDGTVQAWDEVEPSTAERKRVTAAALDLISEAIEPR